jgi:hypothetical protein
MTGMPRQALIQQPKSRASRPRPSGSDCLTLEVVPHELGANYTQNRKERQQERGWFGDRPWMIVAPDGFPNCHDSQTFAGGSWGAQACEIHVGRFEQDAGRQRSRQGKSVRLAKRITVGITGVDRHQAGAALGAADDKRCLNDGLAVRSLPALTRECDPQQALVCAAQLSPPSSIIPWLNSPELDREPRDLWPQMNGTGSRSYGFRSPCCRPGC